MSSTDFSENALVEQPAIALYEELGYEAANCFYEKVGPDNATLGRETTAEVVLVPKLRAALKQLNPEVGDEAIGLAVEELTKDRSAMNLAHANREVYKLLKDGVRVSFQDDEGDEASETLRIIDWKEPDNNEFFLASQFWVSGDIYKRRGDLIGFVNGLPLIFVELKKSHGRLEHAYKNNLKDYKQTISQLFWYNAVIILSNGSEAKIGSITAGWEHFSDWKRINSEGEKGVISLETLIRGTCEKARLLDLVENFTVFDDSKGGLVKVVAKNHQYLGVNNAIAGLAKIKANQGRLGVFWHTQGSGKSFSMIFFSQKVLRRVPGNWTFVVVTDRDDLDNQIYKNFRNTGAVTEECQAESGNDLKQLLQEDHRFIFTLIQKFVTREGKKYPMVSDRSDIIVMTDEAHRSQYDTLALNMRNALPKAAFIGFTGTPLMAGEERTKEVFGDYVSIYNFRQSIEDGATVPLFYENRIPELQLANENFKDDLEALIEQADLDEEQQKKLEKEFAREYHLITRDDRLEKVAEDLVAHFMGREQGGKGMVVCIDKATAVRMYDKVRRYWKAYLADLKAELPLADSLKRPELEARIKFMEETDMAVVVSQQQNEVEEFKKKGLDIEPHRKRMVKEDLETKFKNADDPFRLVFVCAMWMTGFDAPCVSTIYLDKPMKNHTLMQTIARANRVFGEKNNGLIVDYVGVFRDLQKALAIYGSASGGGVKPGESPIQKKDELVVELQEAIDEAVAFNFDALKAHFEKGRKHIEAEKLKGKVGKKLQQMVQLNKARADLLEKFKKLIEEYNSGMDVDTFFERLMVFVKELTEEEQRGVAEQLSEEELAIFDILTKPTPELPEKEKKEVTKVARQLLKTLKEAKLVLDWRKKLKTRADVYATVKTVLDELPRTYTPELYQEKCDRVYRHVYDSYQGEGISVYESA
jgi:type I restriction enzyme, R subunit